MPHATDPFAIVVNARKNRFEADLGDGTLAIAEYKLVPGKIIFTHTEVPSEHAGQGIGSALIRSGLKWAREHHLQVIPICPFFAAFIQSHPDEQDLLDPDWRERLGLGLSQ